jgi:hypothetical protein
MQKHKATDSKSEAAPNPHFMVIETMDGQPIKHRIFLVFMNFLCTVGSVVSAKELCSGRVLIKVTNCCQAKNALHMTTWIGIPVKVSPH